MQVSDERIWPCVGLAYSWLLGLYMDKPVVVLGFPVELVFSRTFGIFGYMVLLVEI